MYISVSWVLLCTLTAVGSVSISVSPSVLESEGWVTVTWHGASFATWNDFIAIYPASVLNSTGMPQPIKYKAAFPQHTTKTPPSHGSTTFYLITRRIQFVVAYVTGTPPFFSILIASDPVSIGNPYLPTQPHLTVVPRRNPAQLALTWNAKAVGTPTWKIGTESGVYQWVAYATPNTYTREDMCDRDKFAVAGRQGWIDPGFMLTAVWSPPQPNTKYFYTFGDQTYGYSTTEYSFYSPPPIGSRSPIVMIGFGDMGQTPMDGSSQHSWDWGDRGEVPTLNTSKTMYNLMEESTKLTNAVFVMHIGDISYAVGFEAEWDQFMHMIQPVASKIPYLSGIGNHEVGYSESYWNGTDSGGECGVPYLTRFPFVSEKITPPEAQTPWYSFQYGMVAVVVMSSEHNYTTGSPQWRYLAQALEDVNRTATPWLVFTGHRCMFWNTSYARLMQEHLEPLLSKHNVDIALWGHTHLYTRTCAMYKYQCLKEGEGGIKHFLIGTAGYQLGGHYPSAGWVEHGNRKNYGIGRFTFKSATEADYEWVDVNSGQVLDSATLKREGD